MSNKLRDRIESYQDSSDYKLLNRVPMIISINGRAFAKSTELLDKPYCPKLAECLMSTMHRLCVEIEGAFFAYQHNDEIVVAVRNDQTPDTSAWFDNKIQKITSVTSAVASLHFSKCAATVDLNLASEPVFTSQVFVVPNMAEAINTMVFKQQQNLFTSIQFACFYELLKKYDKPTIKEMLVGLSTDDKVALLRQECSVDYNSDYPLAFRRGTACYKVPKIVEGESVKNKWVINTDLPIFTRDQSFLSNIFKNGADIFRNDSFKQ